jgi:anti-sigma B factor antagonist
MMTLTPTQQGNSMQDFEISLAGTHATILLGERLVETNVPALRSQLKSLFAGGVTTLLLDCKKLYLLDSTGIGCLVAAHNALSKINGSVSMEAVTPDIYDLLCSLRLDRRIQIAPPNRDQG